MSSVIARIAAAGEFPEIGSLPWPQNEEEKAAELAESFDSESVDLQVANPLVVNGQVGESQAIDSSGMDSPLGDVQRVEPEEERRRRIYRSRTVAMLRRYMRYSMETGRLPSLLRAELFRANVTSYSVSTFEDRVIFVHDMEICLERLDEFSRQLIARHILQEHDQEATARLLGCAERTVRTYMPLVLDMLSGILLEVGLMDAMEGARGR